VWKCGMKYVNIETNKSPYAWHAWHAWFFGICTDLLYRYCFPVSLDMLSLDVLIFTMLSLVTCLISPLSCYYLTMILLGTCTYYDITYHLSPTTCHVNTWPVIITFTEILYLLSSIIYSDLLSCIICTVTWMYSTYVLLNSWTCPAPTILINW